MAGIYDDACDLPSSSDEQSASFEDDEPTTLFMSSKAFADQAAQANTAGDEQEPDREPSPRTPGPEYRAR